ncbi:HTH-type transcriptional regulator LutR [mine drainage metagenome]|uniref:HTH-type transcriptional regulator LutR n=1 Tax=mine drainage metagenome TaxID=410659 RepID=A0A1J5RKV9_9ZZZZ
MTKKTLSDLKILQTRSVSDLVREEILRLIKIGELSAGDKLNELTFAQRFGVSRAPIREAFRALEEAGLVRLEKNRGVFVREITAAEAHELYELRAALDESAARILAPRILPEQLAELRDWLKRLKATASRGDMTQYFPLNIGFHDRIVEMTGNATLLDFYRRVIDRMHLLRRRNFSVPYGSEASQVEHGAIVKALATRDPARAGAAVHTHVMNGYQRLLEVSKTG